MKGRQRGRRGERKEGEEREGMEWHMEGCEEGRGNDINCKEELMVHSCFNFTFTSM